MSKSFYYTSFPAGYHTFMNDQLYLNDHNLEESIHIGTLQMAGNFTHILLTPCWGNVDLLYEEKFFYELCNKNVPLTIFLKSSENYEMIYSQEITFEYHEFLEFKKKIENKAYAFVNLKDNLYLYCRFFRKV